MLCSAFSNYQACNGTNFHFRVNNTMYPQWTSKRSQDWWQHTKLAVGDQGNMLAGAFPHLMRTVIGAIVTARLHLHDDFPTEIRSIGVVVKRGFWPTPPQPPTELISCHNKTVKSPPTPQLGS